MTLSSCDKTVAAGVVSLVCDTRPGHLKTLTGHQAQPSTEIVVLATLARPKSLPVWILPSPERKQSAFPIHL